MIVFMTGMRVQRLVVFLTRPIDQILRESCEMPVTESHTQKKKTKDSSSPH